MKTSKINWDENREVIFTAMAIIEDDQKRLKRTRTRSMRRAPFSEGDYVRLNEDTLKSEMKKDVSRLQIHIENRMGVVSRMRFDPSESEWPRVYRVEAFISMPGIDILALKRFDEIIYFSYNASTPPFTEIASENEIGKDLKLVAELMGLVEGIEHFWDMDKMEPSETGDHGLRSDKLEFNVNADWLSDGYGNVVYKHGHWSRILNEDGSDKEEESSFHSMMGKLLSDVHSETLKLIVEEIKKRRLN